MPESATEGARGVKVMVRFHSAPSLTLEYGPELLTRLDRLERHGLAGKALIDELISPDWASPPTVVAIHGARPTGRYVRRIIRYG